MTSFRESPGSAITNVSIDCLADPPFVTLYEYLNVEEFTDVIPAEIAGATSRNNSNRVIFIRPGLVEKASVPRFSGYATIYSFFARSTNTYFSFSDAGM